MCARGSWLRARVREGFFFGSFDADWSVWRIGIMYGLRVWKFIELVLAVIAELFD